MKMLQNPSFQISQLRIEVYQRWVGFRKVAGNQQCQGSDYNRLLSDV